MSTSKRNLSVTMTALTAASFGLALATGPANAALAEPAVVSTADALPIKALKISLLEWIGENSDYDVSSIITNPPVVHFCERGRPFTYEGKVINFDETIRGIYDETTKEICLAKPWDASNTEDIGVLLHELAHHVQFENRLWLCGQKTEWQAYKLQEAWLQERDIDPEFNWVYIYMSSSCSPRDIHP